MKKTVTTCDKCKEEKDCVSVFLTFQYQHSRGKTFDICKDCCHDANLFSGEPNFQYNDPPTTAEQLIDLLTEIAKSAVES